MKLIIALMLCAAATAAPEPSHYDQFKRPVHPVVPGPSPGVDSLVNKLFEVIRRVIADGYRPEGIPPLDPLALKHYQLSIPAGVIRLDLELRDVYATGFGGFVVHKSDLNLQDLTFDLDISFPRLDISTQYYDLLGDLFTAIPLYGKGKATFIVEDFRFQAKLFLKRSKQAVVIDKIENATFQIRTFKSGITGAVGGGDIDRIVNAMAEDVIIGYVNRFQGAISLITSQYVMAELNPMLEKLDTWRIIEALTPRSL